MSEYTYTTGGQVTGHPLGVTVTLLLVGEHGLVGVAESEVEGLGGEVTDNVGGVATPEGGGALLSDDTLEALANAGVGLGETAGAEHLILEVIVRACSGDELEATVAVGAQGSFLRLDELGDGVDEPGSG